MELRKFGLLRLSKNLWKVCRTCRTFVDNLPKFFEIRMDETEFFNNQTNTTHIEFKLNPTELRLDDNYVFYYVNIARFVVSGLIPLITLTFLHMAIYRYRPLLIITTV